MKIIVCAKQVPDPEAPYTVVQVDSEAKAISTKGVAPVINPYDENALEAALRIKDENGAEVVVVCIGSKISQAVLRRSLAVGADNLVVVDDPQFKNLDSNSIAYALSKAIEKLGEYDLILTGRQGGDWDLGQTGLILGEILGIPTVNLVRSVKIDGGKVVIEKILPGAYELVKSNLPALLTVSSEVGELRYPIAKMRIAAYKQPITVWSAEDIGVDSGKLVQIDMAALLPPPDMGRDCQFIEGDSPEEQGKNLASILKGG
ncbi:MAG: electron transfer flavoprotein subunit beta/FixA family protein [Pseudomonadota bacterium]